MKKLSTITFGLIGPLFLLNTDLSALPNTGNPTTFLGPTAKIGLASSFSNTNTYSAAAEIANNSLRFDGTLGWMLMDNQRFKLSAEYLTQNISYAFFSGNTGQWVRQGAMGANYQYDLGEYTYLFNPQLDVSAYISHSSSKVLRTDNGIFVNKLGQIFIFVDNKRVAGSSAAGISPGLNLHPWEGASVGANLDYDDVGYNTHYTSSKDSKGFGGTAHLNQAFDDYAEVGISAAIRRPFNNYQGHITWLNVPFYGAWSIGVIGAYTIGKNSLPSTYNVGVSVDYLLDQSRCESMSQRQEVLNFLNWTAAPAVYMPQVLAVANEQVTLTPLGPI